ncbi:ArsA family ATPase [Streptomyces sp. NPDC088725]|uniref:ArsA family ATPase n=1 Tax=Streptomyces sp. NPDC088725 TaxID=3365873 RepID=UPI0038016117
MRTVLVTGPGGAGRTTIAAASALAAAKRGDRTLLLTTEPTDDLLGTATGSDLAEPAGITDGLWAVRVDTGAHFRTELLAFQERAAAVLSMLGARELAGEELTELPGSEEFALLHALHRASDGDWDVLVVDLPPLRDALALLALPEQLRRYLRRLVPRERQAARALRPMMAQLAGVPMPSQWLYETVARRDAELAAVQSLLAAPSTSLRLVAEPGPAAQESLRTARTGAALFGLRVDTLVANRLLPRGSVDPWLATLAAQQQKTLEDWYGEWPADGVSLCEVGHLGRDPHGVGDLVLLDLESDCTAFGGTGSGAAGAAGAGAGGAAAGGGLSEGDGLAVERDSGQPVPSSAPWRVEDRIAEEDLLVWVLPLPGAVKSDVKLVRRDDELLLTVGPFRRIVALPSALRRCTVTGAALTDGELRVRFSPDPGLWPRTD